MATTYEIIDKTTLGTTTASITFSAIPSTYTDLVLKVSSRSNAASILDAVFISFNATTTNFAGIFLLGTGGSAVSGSLSRFTGHADAASATSNTFQNGEIYIPNYRSANNKSFSADSVQENNDTTAYSSLAAGLWTITDAITSITLTPDAGSFVSGSSFYLYGIKNS